MRKNEIRKMSALFVFALLALAAAAFALPLNASAEEEQKIVTQYDELWTDDITVKVGTPVKWYVYVPEGVEPKGCGATIKIPDLGFGTDTHNKEEGHIELKQGENLIYEFTPEMERDILFTCWMGSGCHKNYIHAVEVSAAPSDSESSSESRDDSESSAASKAETESTAPDDSSSAEEEYQKVVTEYSDLWTGKISAKAGTPVKWYVNVPEGVEPKGCGATIKIPDLGLGTDTHNKEEGHIQLKQGENFIYEFTPEKTGDILFTCWMGSGCHYNYFHITEDGTYSIASPEDPTDIKAVRDGADVTVSFKAPEAPEGSKIRGYKIIAVDDEGNRKKGTGAESPIILEELDESKNYTITVTTLGTSGKSKGENSCVLSAETVSSTASETDSKAEAAPESKAEPTHEDTSPSEQIVVTNYADLWTSNITVKAGTHVKWYVDVPDGVEPKGCAATIKIPDLGFGTDTHNKNEGHIVLRQGRNFIYEFTPEKTGDILFTCWMGSGCHYNYIHVTADGIADPSAKTGGKAGHSGSDASSKSEVSNERSTANAPSSPTNPDTGSESPIAAEFTVILCAVTVFVSRKRKHMR